MPLTSSAAPLYDSIIWDKCVQSAYSFLKKSKLIMNEEKICKFLNEMQRKNLVLQMNLILLLQQQ